MTRRGQAPSGDARSVRSRAALRDALLTLIEQRPFEDILIKEITAAAGVSYPVFFRQYTRKEDILDEIAADQIGRLMEYTLPLFEGPPGTRSIAAMCAYVSEHRTLWTRLLTTGAATVMREEFRRRANQISAERGRHAPALPVELTSNLVIGGIFEVLSWWLKQPEDYPIANAATLLTKLVIEPVYGDIDLIS